MYLFQNRFLHLREFTIKYMYRTYRTFPYGLKFLAGGEDPLYLPFDSVVCGHFKIENNCSREYSKVQ